MCKATILLLVLCCSLALGAEEKKAVDAPKVSDKLPGVAIGKKAPDFELKDQLGKPKKLSTLLKQGPVALVFHRSASW